MATHCRSTLLPAFGALHAAQSRAACDLRIVCRDGELR